MRQPRQGCPSGARGQWLRRHRVRQTQLLAAGACQPAPRFGCRILRPVALLRLQPCPPHGCLPHRRPHSLFRSSRSTTCSPQVALQRPRCSCSSTASGSAANSKALCMRLLRERHGSSSQQCSRVRRSRVRFADNGRCDHKTDAAGVNGGVLRLRLLLWLMVRASRALGPRKGGRSRANASDFITL
jgi:hypothetical protein